MTPPALPSTPEPPIPARDTVFLSHANPEDNRFTRWLALRLVREGYQVWSDLTGLLGGEDFWHEAERTIRERTAKFVYVLSRVSNAKPGPLKELHVAEAVARREGLRDFLIPVLIDDLPHSDINIQLARLNAIAFNASWASGVASLVTKLQQDGVPQSEAASAHLIGAWWRAHLNADEGVLAVPEDYVSNWFPIGGLPAGIWLHELHGQPTPETALAYPAVWLRPYLISFATTGELGCLSGDQIRTTRLCSTSAFREEGARGIRRVQARDILRNL